MAGSASLEPMQPPNTVSSDRAGCLEIAILLGRRIDDQAIWHAGRCTWVGATPEEGRSGETVTNYATLGPDLYGGSGGIAMFLAELASATGNGQFRRTAKGAIAHALSRASELPANLDRSLYSGRLGITVAAAAVGTALGDAEPLDAASRLIAEAPRPMARDAFDIMSGRAGAIYGLLWLSSILGDVGLRKEALHLARELSEAAERTGDSGPKASWAADRRTAAGNLTGFSHGASGAACALLEVAALGESDLAVVAEQAFAYERSLFDADVRNWPDLRTHPGATARSTRRPVYPVAWCHGAAGIALARLRAFELTGLPVFRQEAQVALETTFLHTRAALRAGVGSYSLCHGLAGNAEILEMGCRVLGLSGTAWRDLALEIATSGIERFGRPGQVWPCGTPEGETPGLMLGLAGAGLFYLQLHDSAIGSALLHVPKMSIGAEN